MIFITGDCHGDYRRFRTDIFIEQKEMTKDDFVIVCGDFGLWDESGEQKYWRKWLSGKPFTTLWVDGNHENYDLLNTDVYKRQNLYSTKGIGTDVEIILPIMTDKSLI